MTGVIRPTTDGIRHNGQSLQEYLDSLSDMVTKPDLEAAIVELEARLAAKLQIDSEDEAFINTLIFG